MFQVLVGAVMHWCNRSISLLWWVSFVVVGLNPMKEIHETEMEMMLKSYKYVNDVIVKDGKIRVGVDGKIPFYDKDAVIGLLVRRWDLKYTGENENGIVGETFLHFEG